jgi:hypothetical protein
MIKKYGVWVKIRENFMSKFFQKEHIGDIRRRLRG